MSSLPISLFWVKNKNNKMNWADIVVMVVGAFGGVTGLVSLYNAKSNKDTIDIKNFHLLIEEERTERQNLAQEYREYKEEVNKKVDEVRHRFEKVESDNRKMLGAIYQAYRCRFPETTDDCPVIRMFNECHSCKHNSKETTPCS